MAVIRERTQVFNKPVGVVRANAGAQQVGNAISQAASTMTQIAFKEAAQDAEQKGIDFAQAVEEKRLRTMNPETGAPEAYKAPEAFGSIAAEAYQRVIDKRFEDSMNSELRLKASEIALKYQYDAESYDQVMSDYIGSMSEGAQGKYKTYVEATGAKYLASTKLNIQERAAARARANAGASISNIIDAKSVDIYNTARAGGFLINEGDPASETDLIIGDGVSLSEDGERSGLLKSGAGDVTSRQLATQAALGGVDYLLSKTSTPSERNAIELALTSGDVNNAPKNLQAEVKELLKYVDGSNVSTVRSHISQNASAYNSVYADQLEAQKAQTEIDERRALLLHEENVDNMGNVSGNIMFNAYEQNNIFAISNAVSSLASLAQKNEQKSNDLFIAGTISKTDRDSAIEEGRRANLQNALLFAASEGNVKELQVALVSPTSQNMQLLTASQQEIVSSIRQNGLYDVQADQGFASEFLNKTHNEVLEQYNKQQAKFAFEQGVANLVDDIQNGRTNEEQISAALSEIASSAGKTHSAVEASKMTSTVRKAAAISIASSFIGNSRTLNLLGEFVDRSGKNPENYPQGVVEAGNKILELVQSTEEVDAVISKISGIESSRSQEEAKQLAETKAIAEQRRLMSGNANADNKSDRELTDTVLLKRGIDLANFYDLPLERQQAAMGIMRAAPPQSLVNDLKLAASGRPVKGLASKIQLFNDLSNDKVFDAESQSGLIVNRFGNSLDKADVMMLEDALDISQTIGGDISEVISNLSRLRSDTNKSTTIKATFGKASPKEFATSVLDGDVYLGEEFAAAAEYLALSGLSEKQIKERLEATFEKNYAKSKYIVDPASPARSIHYSRHSLEREFPDPKARDAFLTAIEEKLPKGYYIRPQPDIGPRGIAVSAAQKNRVYLYPQPTREGTQFLAYYVDEFNELRPLIEDDANGDPFFYSFDHSDIQSFYEQKAAETQQNMLDAAEDQRELRASSLDSIIRQNADAYDKRQAEIGGAR